MQSLQQSTVDSHGGGHLVHHSQVVDKPGHGEAERSLVKRLSQQQGEGEGQRCLSNKVVVSCKHRCLSSRGRGSGVCQTK